MGKYDNHSNAKNIKAAQKKLDKLSNKRKPDLFKIEQAKEELETAKLFESCQIFKSFSDSAPNTKILFSDDNRVLLFVDKLIHYDDIKSYQIVEKFEDKSYTTTKKHGVVTRALVGNVVAGGIGAVVGAASAGSTSRTTHYREGNGFYLRVFLKDGEGYEWYIPNHHDFSNKIHPKWLELGTKLQMIIDGKN